MCFFFPAASNDNLNLNIFKITEYQEQNSMVKK